MDRRVCRRRSSNECVVHLYNCTHTHIYIYVHDHLFVHTHTPCTGRVVAAVVVDTDESSDMWSCGSYQFRRDASSRGNRLALRRHSRAATHMIYNLRRRFRMRDESRVYICMIICNARARSCVCVCMCHV